MPLWLIRTKGIDRVTILTPFRQQLLLRGGRHFATPDQQGLAVEKLRSELRQRVRQNIHAPALLGGNPRFQPQAGGIVYVPADNQRIFSGFVLR